jgi:polyphosphate kinase
MFTCRESFGEDLTELFNLLTGYTRPRRFNHLLVAPTDLRDGLVDAYSARGRARRGGRPARIIAKVNSLVDRPDRGALSSEQRRSPDRPHHPRDLLPASPGCRDCPTAFARSPSSTASSSTRASSIFANHDTPEYLLASADWMPRNLDRRVEIAFPVLDPPFAPRSPPCSTCSSATR